MEGAVDNAGGSPPLTRLNVIEIGASPATEFVGRIIAEHGARVVKLEPPRGAESRRMGPFAKDRDDQDSLHFRYYNLYKESRVFDLDAEGAIAAFDDIIGASDVLISSLHPGELDLLGLDLAALTQRHPSLIVVSVTPFGLTGPWRNHQANDLVSLAAGGPLIMSGYDDHTVPPICPGGGQSFHTGASFAVSGFMIALLERTSSGRGQLVDVAIHDSLAVTTEAGFTYWEYCRQPVLRQTCRHAQPVFTQPATFECADGRMVYFVLITAEQKPWDALVEWMEQSGMAADLADEAFSDPAYRQQNFQHIQTIVECFLKIKSSHDVLREGQQRQLPVGIVYAPEDLYHDEHLLERKFFVTVEEADGSQATYPGSPYRYSAFALSESRRAPQLGETDRTDSASTPKVAKNTAAA